MPRGMSDVDAKFDTAATSTHENILRQPASGLKTCATQLTVTTSCEQLQTARQGLVVSRKHRASCFFLLPLVAFPSFS